MSFSLEAESSRQAIESIKRLLDLLALQAVQGEALIEIAFPAERWLRRTSTPAMESGPAPSDGELTDGPTSKTIRTAP